MRILLFGGTSEGRDLSCYMRDKGFNFTVCVATEYGSELLPGSIAAHVGRMDREEMVRFMADGGYTHVIDATHPYAAVVTATISEACAAAGLPRLRLVRDGDVQGDWPTAGNAREAAEMLLHMPGNVLLTTGSKELDAFALPELLPRCYPRVLPSIASLQRCLDLGFPSRQILCMQGPFTRELNVALLRQYHIDILLTKATGSAGGFWEKVEAAREAGCSLLVIGRPLHETGWSLDEIKEKLDREAER